MTPEEWDQRIEEAFSRVILEVIQEEDLPMEPSDFWKLLAEFSLQDQTKIDLRLSSFKKIGKLLEVMSTKNKAGPGLIDY